MAVIGAGPVGLAAAAHVLERGLRPIVLEGGADVAHSVRQWGHVQLFSPWEYNVDRAADRLLKQSRLEFSRAQPISDRRRTGRTLSRTARSKTALATHIHTSSRVTAISRVGFDKLKTKGREAAPFEIRYQNGHGPDLCGRMPSSTHPARGSRQIRPEPTASTPSARHKPQAVSLMECRMCSGRTAPAMPVRPRRAGRGSFGDRDPRRSRATRATRCRNTSPIWLLRGNDPAKAFGGGATTSSLPEENSAQRLPHWSQPVGSRSKPIFVFRI